MFVIILVLLVCWFLTIGGAVAGVVWFLNNYEVTTKTITLDGDGNNNYVGSENGKVVIPTTSICPEVMPRYNSYTAPTTTA